MTAREAEQMYTPFKFPASYSDTLYRVCFRIYNSLDNELLQALTAVNQRYDWNKLKPGDMILYYPEEVMRQIK